MAGILYFDGVKPEIGAHVLVVVDSANHPTGIWDGKLMEIERNVLHDALKAILSPLGFTRLEQLLGDFLKELKR